MGHEAIENHFRVGESEEGERLDRWLAGRDLGLSRARIQRMIEDGLVLVNGRPVQKRLIVKAGDRVEIRRVDPESGPEEETLPLDIIFEDSQVLVVNKPPMMVVHPARSGETGTLVHSLRSYTDRLSTVGGKDRSGIVHRLDKGTSGILVVARTDEAHEALSRQFKERTVGKAYRAVVWGTMSCLAGDISVPLGRHRRQRKKMAVRCEGGREADTSYEVEECLNHVSIVRLKPGSGRTHQLRVHLSYIGHPIFGDPAYGGRRAPGRIPARERARISDLLRVFPRQALHAEFLAFDHPGDGRRCQYRAALPEDMNRVIVSFREIAGRRPSGAEE
jgi:23S rRNA pseudouridine1911/1915/1917 synthase